jgi:NAD(P)-dependent dehydrogenase (short-subunit alcohol dehydrogenase family)
MPRNVPSILKKTWLITGASRGIGLEMVRQLLAAGETVIATCRNPEKAEHLVTLSPPEETGKADLRVLALDVEKPDSIVKAADSLKNTTIDYLINNAGVLEGQHTGFTDLDFSSVLHSFKVNAVGPMQVTRAMLAMLQLSPKPVVVSITSKMSSIDDNKGGGYYAYRMSKSALNMFNMSLSRDFKSMICVVMHPGWVRTEMGGANAPLTTSDSVSGMIKVIKSLTAEDSGKFIDYRGEKIAW